MSDTRSDSTKETSVDPVTAQLLIRTAGELGVAIVNLLRAGGREGEAAEIETILRRSDANATAIINRAKHELDLLAGRLPAAGDQSGRMGQPGSPTTTRVFDPDDTIDDSRP